LEQIVFYLAILAALAGFGMGLFNLAGPLLKRRNFRLPALSLATLLRRGSTSEDDAELDFDLDDEDDLNAARDFAENSFASEVALLSRRRRLVNADENEELDEELAGVLDEVAQDDFGPDEDEDAYDDGEDAPVVYTVSAEVTDDTEDDESQPDGDAEDEDDEEYDDDEEDETQPEVQVVAAGGGTGDDMLSFFDEAANAGAGAIAAWREDIPEVTIEELLAEARAIRQQIHGKKSNAA